MSDQKIFEMVIEIFNLLSATSIAFINGFDLQSLMEVECCHLMVNSPEIV